MKELLTPSGKPFRFRTCPEGEIIIYPSDEHENHQDREAIVITPYTKRFVMDAIQRKDHILMGASRDHPPKFSLGRLLKDIHQSPQQLSYLTAILQSEGFCRLEKEGNAFVVLKLTPGRSS